MAISRRIFRKQYKRPKPRNISFTNNRIKPETKRSLAISAPSQIRAKLSKAPLRRSLDIRSWNSLTYANRVHEQVHAHRDIHVFAGHYTPKHSMKSGENRFQAYLPSEVWKKMSKQQRQGHLQKRNELAKKGIKLSKPQYRKTGYRAYFINVHARPVLKSMSRTTKKNYLKALIARAKMRAIKIHQEVEPEISRISPNKIKTSFSKQHLVNFRTITKMKNFAKKNALVGSLLPKKFKRKNHG